MKSRRRTRHLVAETLEARLALATYTVNTPGDLLDANPNDGVWDVDLATPGEQMTLAAAAQAINADGGGNVNIAIDGVFSGATFTAAVQINAQSHQVVLNGGTLTIPSASSIINAKFSNGQVNIAGDDTSVKNSSFSGVAVEIRGDDNLFQTNSIVLSPAAGLIVAGNNNNIDSNKIGTDGTTDQGNTSDGIRLIAGPNGSANNLIQKNLISGNGGYGVVVRDVAATNNRLQGNSIGTNATNNGAIPNALGGVWIENSTNVTIGGTTAGTGNIISGNGGSGVRITGSTSTGNAVLSNIIGLSTGTTTALPNAGPGVVISGGQSNKVGDLQGGNYISANQGPGILLVDGAKANLVRSNVIGTNNSNATNVGNTGDGVRIENALENLIDGTGGANRLAGNLGAGLRITGAGSTGNIVRVNLIGLNTSNAALGNAQGGVTIENGASGNTIGGKGVQQNIISANALWGVALRGANNNTLGGNFIGTNVGGTAKLGSQPLGLLIDGGAQNNHVGVLGTTHDPNIISGNAGHGVQISGAGTSNNTLAGNFVGRSNGTAVLANDGYAVLISDNASLNKIGTAIAQQGQFLYAGGLGGVAITTGASQNTVQNNVIDGASGGGYGVLLDNAQNNLIGDPTFGFINFIRNWALAGVRVQGGSLGNRLQGNSTVNNGGTTNNVPTGISLETSLATLPRTPSLRGLEGLPGKVKYYIEALATPGTTVRFDFYANNTPEDYGYGEGNVPIYAASAVVPANGLVQIAVEIPFTLTGYSQFTATLTDANNTTYGFARNVSIVHIPPLSTTLITSPITHDATLINLTATFENISSGVVEYYSGNTYLGSANITTSSGQATLPVFLPQGTHVIAAIFKGAGTRSSAITTPLAIQVTQGPRGIANTDPATVLEDSSVVINVLANDSAPVGTGIVPTSVVITQQPTHGTATVNATTGAITYTPHTNYDGPDTIRYTFRDTLNHVSGEGVVNITVTDIPEPYHNKAKPLDVDQNGVISASDIAYAVNLLNVLGVGPLPPPATPPETLPDVDGDNFLTPTDIALLIAAVNAGANGEAGSSAGDVSSSSPTAEPATKVAQLDAPLATTSSPSDVVDLVSTATSESLTVSQAAVAALLYYPLEDAANDFAAIGSSAQTDDDQTTLDELWALWE